ncbi:unnamed protein product [Heterosigma akashiwo]
MAKSIYGAVKPVLDPAFHPEQGVHPIFHTSDLPPTYPEFQRTDTTKLAEAGRALFAAANSGHDIDEVLRDFQHGTQNLQQHVTHDLPIHLPGGVAADISHFGYRQ